LRDGEAGALQFTGKWTGRKAAELYRRLKGVLEKKYPGARKFFIMEDNDPSYNKHRNFT
jgi:hypothetical protein